MLGTQKALNGWHVTTAQCTKGVEQKICWLAQEETRESAARAFQDYRKPTETVTCFKYMGRVMAELDENWMTLVGNLQKYRKSWARPKRIPGREGAIPRVTGIFFKTVVQPVRLFGLETWVTTPHTGRSMGGFQHRLDIRNTGMKLKRQVDGSWQYPLMDTAIEEAGFKDM